MRKNKITKTLLALVLALTCTIAFAACGNDGNNDDEKKTYTVTFNANGGIGTMANQTFTEDIAQSLTVNAFTKDGHSFLGWATSASGNVVYVDGAVLTMSENKDLFAIWSETQLSTADFIPIAQNVNVGSSLTLPTYYVLEILDDTYYGQMIKINGTMGNEYEITISDTSVYGWILCKADGSIDEIGLFSNGKSKFTSKGGFSYILIGFKTAPSGAFTVTIADYVATLGESEKYAINLVEGTATASISLKEYQQVWYQVIIPDDGKNYGISVNKTGAVGSNLTVYVFDKKQDGTADRENYIFAFVNQTGASTAPFNNFAFPSSTSASVGSGLVIVAGNTYYVAIMANTDGISCTLLFNEII